MRVSIETDERTPSEEQEERGRRRVLFTLGRFADRIARVRVRWRQGRDRVGTPEHRCRLRLWLRPRGSIETEARGPRREGLLDAALRAAARRIRIAEARAFDPPLGNERRRSAEEEQP